MKQFIIRFVRMRSLPWILALIIAAPIVWMATDRVQPWVRLKGELNPSVVEPGGSTQATFTVTRVTRYCEGKVQREIIDSQRNVWPKLQQQTVGVWKPTQLDPNIGTIVTPPVQIPEFVAEGPAIYRVQTFFYCNWLQKVLNWPLVQVGPDIPFEVRRER